MDKDIPGTGAYNPQHHAQIGVNKIQGGAPNNFSLLVKKSISQQEGGNADRLGK